MAETFANNAVTTLSAGCTDVAVTIDVTSAALFPVAAQYRIIIDNEIMIVTAGAGTTTWTVTRHAEGTTATSHAAGAAVTHILTKEVMEALLQTSGLLTAIQGVDGTGSGLDADLLDGSEGALYLLKSGGTMTGVLNLDYKGLTEVYSQVITVNAAGGADYTTIAAAIAAITESSISKPYCILVYDGVYAEDLTMPAAGYISLTGISKNVVIKPETATPITLTLTVGCQLANVTMLGPNSTQYLVTVTGALVVIQDCVITSTNGAEQISAAVRVTSTGGLTCRNTLIVNTGSGAGAGSETYGIRYESVENLVLDNVMVYATSKGTGASAALKLTAHPASNIIRGSTFSGVSTGGYSIDRTGVAGVLSVNDCRLMGPWRQAVNVVNQYDGKHNFCTNNGTFGIGTGATDAAAQLEVKSLAVGTIGAIVKGAASQTANLQEWRDSSANIVALITKAGGLVVNEFGNDIDSRIEGDTDANLLYIDAGADRVGIGTAAPNAKLDVRGGVIVNEDGADVDSRIEGDTEDNLFYVDAGLDAVQIGDHDTNYTQIDKTGHQTMVGAAKAWEDLRIEPQARTTGDNAPTFEQWFTNGAGSRGVYLYSFDDAAAASEKEVFFTIQFPHAWDQGAIHMHVHWMPAVDDTTATPRWGLEYTWAEPGTIFGNSTIIYAIGNEQAAADLVAFTHYLTEFAALIPSASQDGLSSILIGRLFRNSGDAADTYNAGGAKCGLLYIDAHYQLNSLGSNDEYTK